MSSRRAADPEVTDRARRIADEWWKNATPLLAVQRVGEALGAWTNSKVRKITRVQLRKVALVLAAPDGSSRILGLHRYEREMARMLAIRASMAFHADEAGVALFEALRRIPPPDKVPGLPNAGVPGPEVGVLLGTTRFTGERVKLEVAPVVALREVAAQEEVLRVLADVGRKTYWHPGWKKIQPTTVDRFKKLVPQDFTVYALRAHAWPALLAASSLTVQTTSASYGLSKRGVKLLQSGAARDALWSVFWGWQHCDELDELSLWPDAAPNGTASVRAFEDARVRREMTLAAMRLLPVGQWVEIATLVNHLLYQNMTPRVSSQIWPTTYHLKHHPVRSWRWDVEDGEPLLVRVPTLIQIMFQVLATLGVLDVAYVTQGPGAIRQRTRAASAINAPWSWLTHVRLTSLGAGLIEPVVLVPVAQPIAAGRKAAGAAAAASPDPAPPPPPRPDASSLDDLAALLTDD